MAGHFGRDHACDVTLESREHGGEGSTGGPDAMSDGDRRKCSLTGRLVGMYARFTDSEDARRESAPPQRHPSDPLGEGEKQRHGN